MPTVLKCRYYSSKLDIFALSILQWFLIFLSSNPFIAHNNIEKSDTPGFCKLKENIPEVLGAECSFTWLFLFMW